MIALLEAEVRTLSSLLLPQIAPPSPTALEADSILSGNQGDSEPLPLSEEDRQTAADIAERDSLLAGNY